MSMLGLAGPAGDAAMTVGFVGLGKMGGHMARHMAHHLSKTDGPLLVFDLSSSAVDAAVENGARLASVHEMGAAANTVILSLPSPDAVRRVLDGDEGLFHKGKPGLLIINTTTMAIDESIAFAEQARNYGMDYLEAPISGGVAGAAAGDLALMIGGDATILERAHSLLMSIAGQIVHVGPVGSAMALKLINQAIYVSYMSAFAEGLALGESVGIPLNTLLDVLGASMAGRPVIENKFDEIRGKASTGFPTRNALGYLDLTIEGFKTSASLFPTILAARESLSRAVSFGVEKEDLIVARHSYLTKI
jgi:3-hydroxyisobutyrate dehydrogenase-like beta-hydroxyacid dehydrogenase